MKINNMRVAAAVMAAIVVFIIGTSCKNRDDLSDNIDQSDSLNNQSELTHNSSDYTYVAEFIPIQGNVGEIVENSFNFIGDKLFFATWRDKEGGEETYFLPVTESKLYSINLDGTGLSELTNYTSPVTLPARSPGGVIIARMIADSVGSFWVYEQWGYHEFDLPDGFDIQNDSVHNYETIYGGYTFRKLDSTGSEILAVDLNALFGDSSFIDVIGIDGNDNVYLKAYNTDSGNDAIYVLDSNGNKQFELSVNDYFTRFTPAQDGAIGFIVDSYDEIRGAKRELQVIDFTVKALGDAVPLSLISGIYHTGSGGYDTLLTDLANLYGVNIGEDPVVLLSWNDVGIRNNGDGIMNIAILPDERIAMASRSPDFSGYEIVVLTKTLYSEITDKTILILVTCNPATRLVDAVNEFNRTDPDYYIRIEDYSKYDTGNGTDGVQMRLATELSSGIIPDIIDVTYFPYNVYAENGLLTDLYQLIDSDPDFNRNDFLQGIFSAAEIDDKLPIVFPKFYINTLIAHPSVIEADGGWNAAEFTRVIESRHNADMPIGMMTSAEFLMYAVSSGINDYIDLETATARFDSAEFIQLLELSNRLRYESIGSETYISSEEAIATGRQIVERAIIWNFYSVSEYKVWFGGQITYMGYPTENRNGHSLSIEHGFAIPEYSSNKEAAWHFVRIFLDSDYQLSISGGSGFPTNQAAFEHRITDALDGFSESGGTVLPQNKNVTQADIEQLVALIGSVSGISGWVDNSVLNIINEDASDYFNDITSAEQAARNIQSRVSIYLSERYG